MTNCPPPSPTSPYPDGAVVMAPLSGYTDLPFRRSIRRHGAHFAFTEMIDAGSLVLGGRKTRRFLERGEHEPWLGVQLLGSDHELLARATELLNEYAFDLLDFNLGCPAPKVAKKGEGAVLGEDGRRAVAAFRAIRARAAMPVTAKIRIQDEQDPEPTLALAEALAEAGAAAITIHGRMRRAIYAGPVAMSVIAAVRERLTIPVLANGGAFDATSASHLRTATGCSRIMLARGAMGNPWLFAELADPESFRPPSVTALVDELEQHVRDMASHYGETQGIVISRKVILDYLKGRGYSGELRAAVGKLASLAELNPYLEQLRAGPGPRYWQWLAANPAAPRRLQHE